MMSEGPDPSVVSYTPVAGKGVKRPRPSSPNVDEDTECPDLAAFQADFSLSDVEMIKLCTTFAAYLKATHRKTR